jgi:hypothetical protein
VTSLLQSPEGKEKYMPLEKNDELWAQGNICSKILIYNSITPFSLLKKMISFLQSLSNMQKSSFAITFQNCDCWWRIVFLCEYNLFSLILNNVLRTYCSSWMTERSIDVCIHTHTYRNTPTFTNIPCSTNAHIKY